MLFRQIIPIIYKSLLFISASIILLGCSTHPITSAEESARPLESIRNVILIQKNDVKLVDLSNETQLHASLSELMILIIGAKQAKQLIASLSDPQHPFFVATLIKHYQQANLQSDVDIYDFKKNLLFDFAESHGIYLQISNLRVF